MCLHESTGDRVTLSRRGGIRHGERHTTEHGDNGKPHHHQGSANEREPSRRLSRSNPPRVRYVPTSLLLNSLLCRGFRVTARRTPRQRRGRALRASGLFVIGYVLAPPSLIGAQEGTRNDRLVRVSYRAGRLSAAGEVAEIVANDVLVEAAQRVGLRVAEAERTFRSGFGAGSRLAAVRASR